MAPPDRPHMPLHAALFAGLVVIAVVAGAFTFWYLGNSGCCPVHLPGWHVTLAAPSETSYGSPRTFVINTTVSVVPYNGAGPLSTADLGLSIIAANDIAIPGGSPVGCIHAGDSFGSCQGSSGGWYAVLLGTTGSVLDTYNASAGDWGSPAVNVGQGDSVSLISSASLTNLGLTLHCFGVAGFSIESSGLSLTQS